MLIWYLLEEKPEQQRALKALYKELAGIDFKPPVEDEPRIHVDAKMESSEELARLAKKPTRFRRRPK